MYASQAGSHEHVFNEKVLKLCDSDESFYVFLCKSCDDPTQVEEVKLQCVELSRPP